MIMIMMATVAAEAPEAAMMILIAHKGRRIGAPLAL